ncbi:BnaCnng07600D [Brassica napus]|uniref:BnaCnng07600D protein n=1 Tax=Brassica napus TaxID=3708 RepID=A0A078HIL6_BRANA|nr:BnaCnng07600D [Brassica napus]
MGVGLFGLGVVVRISLADSGTAVARRLFVSGGCFLRTILLIVLAVASGKVCSFAGLLNATYSSYICNSRLCIYFLRGDKKKGYAVQYMFYANYDFKYSYMISFNKNVAKYGKGNKIYNK